MKMTRFRTHLTFKVATNPGSSGEISRRNVQSTRTFSAWTNICIENKLRCAFLFFRLSFSLGRQFRNHLFTCSRPCFSSCFYIFCCRLLSLRLSDVNQLNLHTRKKEGKKTNGGWENPELPALYTFFMIPACVSLSLFLHLPPIFPLLEKLWLKFVNVFILFCPCLFGLCVCVK